ncbi:Brain protein I3 [Trinorchestia longiramus]|nr:Brain protein I3 [Trinorchestia longiramus]
MSYPVQQNQGHPPPYPTNQPPMGYAGYPPPNGYPQNVTMQGHPTTINMFQQPPGTQIPHVVPVAAVGSCPVCRVGNLENNFTCCGIFLAIICFPIGFICCCLMKERRCSNCNANFG